MAFPSGWTCRAPITIESDDIDATLTNWTLVFDQTFDSVLTQADGPLDADGTRASINGGGDVRFSTDEAGTTQIACDIRSWVTHNTPASATCEVAVKVPSVSSSVDTIIYMWWGASGETQPAVDATYGQYDAYDAYHVGVWDMGQDPSGGSGCILDRTENQHHGTPAGTMLTEDLVTGGVGGSLHFDGTDDLVSLGDSDDFSFTTGSPDGPFTMEALVNADDKTTNDFAVLGKGLDWNTGEYWMDFGNNVLRARIFDYSADAYIGATNYEDGLVWEHIAATYNGGGAWTDIYLYQDGERLEESTQTTGTYVEMENTSYELVIGALTTSGASPFDGIIDEVRLSNVERSAAWIAANWSNQTDAAGFLTWGSITDIEVSSDTELVVADISHALAFDAPVLTQAHTLVVADVDIDLGFNGAGAGDGLWDLGAYIYPLGGDGIVLVQEDPDIVVADVSLALSYEAPVLTQAHTLVVADIAHALAFDAPVLTQAHTLVVADAAIDLAFDAPVLTQGHDFSATVAAVTTTGSVTLDITHDFSATVVATFSTGAATVVTVTTDEFSATVAASFTTGAAILATGAPINSIDSTITSVTTARTITSSTTARTITSSTTARTTTSSTTARTINSK